MSDRDAFRANRDAGLRARHETREDRFHERVCEVLAEGIAGGHVPPNHLPMYVSQRSAEIFAAAGYQALLAAGYVVIPAAEEGS